MLRMVLPRAVSHPLSDSLKLLRLTQDGFLPAGKRKSGKTRDGNRWLKRTVCQASWAVTRKKKLLSGSAIQTHATKRGLKRALIAVAHTMLRARAKITWQNPLP